MIVSENKCSRWKENKSPRMDRVDVRAKFRSVSFSCLVVRKVGIVLVLI